ncbi:MAG TPA: YaeQ family protein [Geopsychrobacteraceae bacterium]|nr:YaeQ family protein [Geopsychrobacteraceae bacterium]
MALKATIHRVSLQIADMDRNYYQDHNLVIARHPSETDERMMIRLFAFVLHAAENLQFTKGLCVDDEPDLWLKNLTNEIELWIDIGLPDENRIRKACGRAREVILYCYGGRSVRIWWERNAAKLNRFKNLKIINLSAESTAALASLTRRSMELHCSIQDGQVCLGDAATNLVIIPEPFLQPEC